MSDLFASAYQLRSKQHHKIWLVWTIGEYANGCPWVELRCIYTDEERAERVAQDIRLHEIPRYVKSGLHIKRVHVEKRVTNHKYGGEMMELAVVRGKI